MRSKVTVVGAGNVGATTAQRIHQLGYADVVLVDVVEDLNLESRWEAYVAAG